MGSMYGDEDGTWSQQRIYVCVCVYVCVCAWKAMCVARWKECLMRRDGELSKSEECDLDA